MSDQIDMPKFKEGLKEANRKIIFDDTDSVFVLGPTRAGKSTLATLLSQMYENEMHKDYFNGEKTISADTGPGDLAISALAQACTTFPAKVKAKDGTVYHDTPGSGDNKGITQEILNAYYINRLLNNARRVKTVFVIAYFQLRGAAKEFIKGVALVFEMFESVTNLKEMLTLVVTGVPADIDEEDIKQALQERIIKSERLADKGIDKVKEYCKSLVEGNTQIVAMKEPEFTVAERGKSIILQPNEYSAFIAKMSSVIKASGEIARNAAPKIAITDEAKSALETFLSTLIAELATYFKDLMKEIEEYELRNRFGNLIAEEKSIVSAAKALKEFDGHSWMLQLKENKRQVANLNKVDLWTSPEFQYPSTFFDAMRPICTKISDQVCLLVFFHRVLKKDEFSFSEELFRQIDEPMNTLKRFYATQKIEVSKQAKIRLEALLCKTTEPILLTFYKNTMENAAAYLECIAALTAKAGDMLKLTDALDESDILAEQTMSKPQYDHLKKSLASARTISEVLEHDMVDFSVGSEFKSMNVRCLQEYSTCSKELNEYCDEIVRRATGNAPARAGGEDLRHQFASIQPNVVSSHNAMEIDSKRREIQTSYEELLSNHEQLKRTNAFLEKSMTKEGPAQLQKEIAELQIAKGKHEGEVKTLKEDAAVHTQNIKELRDLHAQEKAELQKANDQQTEELKSTKEDAAQNITALRDMHTQTKLDLTHAQECKHGFPALKVLMFVLMFLCACVVVTICFLDPNGRRSCEADYTVPVHVVQTTRTSADDKHVVAQILEYFLPKS